jgi:gliding-associated putative ABC transporter substrate-binding component GldG
MNFLNRFKYARDSYLITVLIVIIALMLNFIAARHFVKVDLTKNQLYAVSDASKKIMGNLDDIVTVKVFFSDTLPPNLFAVRQYVEDMLNELSSYSKGNLSIEFLDPSDTNVQNEALKLGIPQIQMNIIEKDKLEVKNGFLGIAITYGDKTEILPVVQNIMNVEYDLVAAIKKVTAKETKVIGFAIGHDEPSLADHVTVNQQGDTYSYLKRSLDRNYSVKEVDLSNSDSLKGVNTLLIAGSKKIFSDQEKYTIDQFLMKGGNLVAMIDSVDVSQDLKPTSLDLGLNDMLESYGVGLDKELVLDKSNENASFNQGYVNFIIPYPFWVKAINKDFDKTNPVVANLDSVVFPWVSPLTITNKEGLKSTVLINTTQDAWTAGDPLNLAPGTTQNISSKKQYPLAALLEGNFASFFSDKSDKTDLIKKSEKPARILVIGNSRFITDRFLDNFGQNMSFGMNAIDYLTLDDSLISIRSKTSFDLPLEDLSITDRQIVKFAGIFLMPILVVIFGVARFFTRRRQSNNIL